MRTILILVTIAAAFLIIIYNRMVAMRQAWKNALADIDVQMKQRQDLVPNLVETVKGAATQESGVLEKVTEARAAAMGAKSPADKTAAEGALTAALANLMAMAENDPHLKANHNFLQLQSELADIDHKSAAARHFFDTAVTNYNTAIGQFPASLIAGSFGFAQADAHALGAPEKAD